jgi:hypothetical protein
VDADLFMKSTTPSKQTTVVSEGPVERQSRSLIGYFGLYTAIGSVVRKDYAALR